MKNDNCKARFAAKWSAGLRPGGLVGSATTSRVGDRRSALEEIVKKFLLLTALVGRGAFRARTDGAVDARAA